MSKRISSIASIVRYIAACSAVCVVSTGQTATTSIEALLNRDFSSIRLSQAPSETTELNTNARLTLHAAIGPVEAVDLASNQILVAGQIVDMTDLDIDSYRVGDHVAIAGIVTATGITDATVKSLPDAYVFGASLSYVEGFVARSNPSTAIAKVGNATVDFSGALSRSLGSPTSLIEGTYVRFIGIQTSAGLITVADLEIVRTSVDSDPLTRNVSLTEPKILNSGNLAASAIVGGDRSTKAIIGGDRSAKAIIGGDRSTKAIIGGDRSAKVILGGDRSAKATARDSNSHK